MNTFITVARLRMDNFVTRCKHAWNCYRLRSSLPTVSWIISERLVNTTWITQDYSVISSCLRWLSCYSNFHVLIWTQYWLTTFFDFDRTAEEAGTLFAADEWVIQYVNCFQLHTLNVVPYSLWNSHRVTHTQARIMFACPKATQFPFQYGAGRSLSPIGRDVHL